MFLYLSTGFSLLEPLQMWLLQFKKKQPWLYQVYPNLQTQIWEVEMKISPFPLGLQSHAKKHSSVLHSSPGNRDLKGRKLIISRLPSCKDSYRKIAGQLPFLENTFPSLKHLSHSSSMEGQSDFFFPLNSQKNILRSPLQSCTETTNDTLYKHQ